MHPIHQLAIQREAGCASDAIFCGIGAGIGDDLLQLCIVSQAFIHLYPVISALFHHGIEIQRAGQGAEARGITLAPQCSLRWCGMLRLGQPGALSGHEHGVVLQEPVLWAALHQHGGNKVHDIAEH